MLVVLGMASTARAQVEIAPIISFQAGRPLFIDRTTGKLNQFTPDVAATSSVSTSYGIGAEVLATISHRFGISGDLEYVYTSGYFNASQFSVSGIDRSILLDLDASVRSGPFVLRAGPWLSARISSNVYENDSTGSRTIAAGDTIASKATHAGVLAGVAWRIHGFPLQPELTARLDLSDPQAGSSAWSFGLSVAYPFGANAPEKFPPETTGQEAAVPAQNSPSASNVIPSVTFLVNGRRPNGNPPLERVETRIKEYRMVDRANTPPNVTQWVEESYHLPHIAISCTFDRAAGGYLMVLKDSLRIIEKTFSNRFTSNDTVLDLDDDPAWRTVLAHMTTDESNRLIAELRVSSREPVAARDTLVLPPGDTVLGHASIENNEYRFILSDRFTEYPGGSEALSLLISRMKSLADSGATLTIREPRNPGQKQDELLSRIRSALGNKYFEAQREEVADLPHTIEVVFHL